MVGLFKVIELAVSNMICLGIRMGYMSCTLYWWNEHPVMASEKRERRTKIYVLRVDHIIVIHILRNNFRRIMECVTTINFSISIYGELNGF
jgi:hypothetical protein